jgi:hypothetical protein
MQPDQAAILYIGMFFVTKFLPILLLLINLNQTLMRLHLPDWQRQVWRPKFGGFSQR